MRILKFRIFPLIFFLFGAACAGASPPGSGAAPADHSGPGCPARDFSDFIKLFSENTAVQRKFTRFPLEKLEVNAIADPEPEPFTRTLERGQINFPVIPNRAEREKYGLEMFPLRYGPDRVTLHVEMPETDVVVVSYYFAFDSGCWNLVRIEDWSL